jgi:hypothetical protein
LTPPDRGGQGIIRRYAVLCGLTPLVPLPLVDDLAKMYLRRRLVRALAGIRAVALSADDVRALADEPRPGCVSGCFLFAIVYPVRKLFRTIFFFLEWKRAIDTTSETYHYGSLADYALQCGWCTAGEHARVRAAIDAVLRRRGTSPIEAAIGETLRRSKATVFGAAHGLKSALLGTQRRSREEQVEKAIDSMDAHENGIVDALAGQLGQALDQVPAGYLDSLCAQLAEELARSTREE